MEDTNLTPDFESNFSHTETSQAKLPYSQLGFALCVMIVLSELAQWLALFLFHKVCGEQAALKGLWLWVVTFAPIYLIAIPCGYLLMRRIPAAPKEKSRLLPKEYLRYLAICVPLMYGGSLIGTILSLLLSRGTAQNSLIDYAMDSSPLRVLIVVFIAPAIEEFVFRKQLIDRTSSFGEAEAIIISALAFGLFHGNLYQFFYAAAIGLVFGYVYVRTGNIRYSYAMHSTINFFGGVIAPFIIKKMNLTALMDIEAHYEVTGEIDMLRMQDVQDGVLMFLGYLLFVFVVCIFGIIFLKREVRGGLMPLNEPEPRVTKRQIVLNAGVITFIVLCIAEACYALWS